MRKLLVCLFLLALPATAAVPMSRVIEVRDSRTIMVVTNGAASLVTLRGVSVAPNDEARAVEYLRRSVTGSWVYVEEGEVYRSPDGLHVNAAMRRRAWLGFTWLGETPPAANSKKAARRKK